MQQRPVLPFRCSAPGAAELGEDASAGGGVRQSPTRQWRAGPSADATAQRVRRALLRPRLRRGRNAGLTCGGHESILKRLRVHAGAFNLGLLMRKVFSRGTPQGLQGCQVDPRSIASEKLLRAHLITLQDVEADPCRIVLPWFHSGSNSSESSARGTIRPCHHPSESRAFTPPYMPVRRPQGSLLISGSASPTTVRPPCVQRRSDSAGD